MFSRAHSQSACATKILPEPTFSPTYLAAVVLGIEFSHNLSRLWIFSRAASANPHRLNKPRKKRVYFVIRGEARNLSSV
jgi:hypothetical protein